MWQQPRCQWLCSSALPWGALLRSAELIVACTKAARALPIILEPLGILGAG